MLIEFSVANFKSIKEKQTLSMVANNADKEHLDHLIEVDSPGISNNRLLKSTAIYGANASGKSNFFKAAKFMRNFVLESATDLKPNDETGVVPFKLDSKFIKKPSEFEVIFIHDNIRYQYGFSLDKTQVYEEWLIAYPQGRPQTWFERSYDRKRKVYDWNYSDRHFKGSKKSIEDKTRKNNLFISVGAQFNHEQLNAIYHSLHNELRLLDCSNPIFPSQITLSLLQDNANQKQKKAILDFIKKADLGISDIHIETITPDKLEFPEDVPLPVRKIILDDLKGGKIVNFNFEHFSYGQIKPIRFDIDEESAGTIKLFFILGHLFDSLLKGKTLFVDEIASKLHPLLLQNLIKTFHEHNNKNSQLILTTHDATLLNQHIFRRDQIWFTNKNYYGETDLYPLTDYKPRPGESLQKGYLSGRYGGIPMIEEEFSMK